MQFMWALIHVPAALLTIQLPAGGLGKEVEGGPSAWALLLMLKTWKKLLTVVLTWPNFVHCEPPEWKISVFVSLSNSDFQIN